MPGNFSAFETFPVHYNCQDDSEWLAFLTSPASVYKRISVTKCNSDSGSGNRTQTRVRSLSVSLPSSFLYTTLITFTSFVATVLMHCAACAQNLHRCSMSGREWSQVTAYTKLILFPLCLSPLYSETLPGRQYTENKERYRLFLTPLFSNSSLSHGRLVQPVVIYFISFFSFFCLVSFKNTCSSYAHTFFSLGLFISPMT